jgi:hypothetical protein
MRTHLPIAHTQYLAEFVLVACQDIWPKAVILDRAADTRHCRGLPVPLEGYGFDVCASEETVAALLDGEPSGDVLHVDVSDGPLFEIGLAGNAAAVQSLTNHPLWSSRRV